MSERLFLPREHKTHIFSTPCNILYLRVTSGEVTSNTGRLVTSLYLCVFFLQKQERLRRYFTVYYNNCIFFIYSVHPRLRINDMRAEYSHFFQPITYKNDEISKNWQIL